MPITPQYLHFHPTGQFAHLFLVHVGQHEWKPGYFFVALCRIAALNTTLATHLPYTPPPPSSSSDWQLTEQKYIPETEGLGGIETWVQGRIERFVFHQEMYFSQPAAV
jgi:hypothetical protein